MTETRDYEVTFCDDNGSQYMVEIAPRQVRHVPHAACQVAKRPEGAGDRMTLRMTPERARQFGIVKEA